MNYSDKVLELKDQERSFEQKIEDTKRDIAKFDNNEIPMDVAAYQNLQSKLSNSQARLAEIQQQIAELVGVGEEVQLQAENEFSNIAGQGVTLRELVTSEAAYQLIAVHIKNEMVKLANDNAVLVQSYKSEIKALSEAVDELSMIKAENEKLHAENIELGEQVIDLTAKREAAAREIESLKSDNARLKEDAAKLREQLENRNKVSEGPQDTASFAEQIKAQRKTVYDVKPITNSVGAVIRYAAKLADTHEPIDFPAFALAGYNVLEGEELARFQKELEDKRAAEQAKIDEAQKAALVAPSLPSINAEVSTNSTNGEVAPKEVTRAEFEALKADVESMKKEFSFMNIAI